MKAIVVYYSLTGKTELVATAAARVLGIESRKIEEVNQRKPGPVVYTFGSLAALTNSTSRIKPLELDTNNYNLVLVGTPVWAGRPVPAVNAFIKQTDFKGKDVIVFCSCQDLKGSAKVLENLAEKVKKQTGSVIGSFAVSSNKTTDQQMVETTREEVRKYRGHK